HRPRPAHRARRLGAGQGRGPVGDGERRAARRLPRDEPGGDPVHGTPHREHPCSPRRDRRRRHVQGQQRYVVPRRRAPRQVGRLLILYRAARPRRSTTEPAMEKSFRNYVGGEWVPAASGKTFENRNPADTSELIGTFADSAPQDVERAVAAAREAFPRWKATPAPKRGEILYRAAEILVKRKEEFSRDMTREMGKVLDETRGDAQEAIDMTYYMAGEGRRQFGQTTPSELRNKFQMSVRQPVGIAGLITPWNFPMAIPSWKMMPALILGNSVVIKPATDTPLSVVNLIKALEEAGLPKGVVNMVTGRGLEAGAPLMHHKDVGIVSFTGSTGVGRKVSEACAPAFKHCHLEMRG